MSGLNKIVIIGNLGQDPELEYTTSGVAVANFSVAVNEQWKDKDGNKQEHVEWFRCVAWRKIGEICGEYLKKGQQVYIEGSQRTRSYDDKEGIKRYAVDLVIDKMLMLGSKGVASDDKNYKKKVEEEAATVVGNDKGVEDDLPF
jgi:single-strand DNA-binding protein